MSCSWNIGTRRYKETAALILIVLAFKVLLVSKDRKKEKHKETNVEK